MKSVAALPDLLTVHDVVERWKKWGITADHVRRLHRKKILRASLIRKKPMLFHIDQVRAVEEGLQ